MANLTLKLAEHVTNVGARAAYGEPIEQDGTKIIPVALACFGFGAGEVGDSGESGGGGGGGSSVPVGAYVTRDGVTRFEPNIIALLAVGTPFVFFAGRALARVIKALKR
ncbi:MAG: hypothetical protein ACTJFR_05195 [Canibacter sp.]